MYLIRIVEIAARDVIGEAINRQYAGKYIVDHVDTRDGRGRTRVTPNPRKARLFPSSIEAGQYWKQQSTLVPYRPDGQPNRPLTAFMVEIISESEA